MEKIKVEDLKEIKERMKKESALSKDTYTVKITVHMGTCGIAAGADEVYKALNEEKERLKRDDIKVVISACMGMCSSEPNVTVRRLGEDAVLYGDLNGEKMRKIFQGHILNGEIQSDLAVARIK